MDSVSNIIARTQLFSDLSADQQEQIKTIIQERGFDKGETIFWEGEEGIGFYIVAQGMVKIYKVSSEGKEQILHIYGPGQPFGKCRFSPAGTSPPMPRLWKRAVCSFCRAGHSSN